MMVLSGSRPIVTIRPIEHSFNTRSSNCRISLGIVPPSGLPSPGAPYAPPPAGHHFHDHNRHVVGAAMAVGRVDQVIADSLRLTQIENGPRHRRLRYHARETVAAEQQVVAR